MVPVTQILNWLAIGFELPTGSLTELFYYDKRDSEFFSVMAVDYFMLDEHMNVASNVTTNYSKTQEATLVDRMKRIENKDPAIIFIPRITLEDRKTFMEQFVGSLDNTNLVEVLTEQIQKQDYKSKFDFHFSDETATVAKQKWESEKNDYLLGEVDTFLNLNSININNTTLWLDNDAESSISIDLTDASTCEPLPSIDKPSNSKPWWKFW
jgi:hypothetical protein